MALLVSVMVAVGGLPLTVLAAEPDSELITTVPHTQQDSSQANYFTFAPGKWEGGNETHIWSKPLDSSAPGDTYYEVHFTGHKIDVYAGKNRPMGKVEYFIDGTSKGVYSLYHSSNVNEALIASFDGLGDGNHVLKAVATGEKDSAATGTLIDCAKVVVYSSQASESSAPALPAGKVWAYINANSKWGLGTSSHALKLYQMADENAASGEAASSIEDGGIYLIGDPDPTNRNDAFTLMYAQSGNTDCCGGGSSAPGDTYTLPSGCQNHRANHMFRLTRDSDGWYTIQSLSNDKYLSTSAVGTYGHIPFSDTPARFAVVKAGESGMFTIAAAVDDPDAGELEDGDTKKLNMRPTIPLVRLPEENQGDVEGPDVKGGPRQYLGQPDMIMLPDGTLVTVFPVGHGHGPLVMKKSTDRGRTWTEIETPESWARSLETPTMYRLDMTDGSQKYVMISARPNWDYNAGTGKGGWDASLSTDGLNWSNSTTYHEDVGYTIVAMASLVQLRDEEGNPIDKWMGVFHDYSFHNYKTYLTFDENGNMQWSEPELYLSQYRALEEKYHICEVGMFRAPDDSDHPNRIVALARSDNHNNVHASTMFWSDDEGETWSKPVEMQGALAGERHKARYDPISGRLVIAFREIIWDTNNNGVFEGSRDWLAGDWVAWVGTYEDLMERNEGQYRILLDEDWANNTYSGDTGYSGMAVYSDGTFVLDSYGHWDKEFSQTQGYDVRVDRCWIRWASFTLEEMDALYSEILGPSETPDPSETPEPSETPDPSETPEPSESPDPSESPEPIEPSAPPVLPVVPEIIIPTEPDEGIDDGDTPLGELPFLDVDHEEWYAQSIANVVAKGLMEGVDALFFAPRDAMTRGMMAQALYALAQKPEIEDSASFLDLADGVNYADAVAWGSANGVIKGYSETEFGGEDALNRQQLAVLLYRYAGEIEKLDVSADASVLEEFTDCDRVSAWAEEAMAWAVAKELVEGRTDGTLDPRAIITRAEAAAILDRYFKQFLA